MKGTPTVSEVRSARAKAVGGKRDRCKKGKPCSAACIERNDRCLVEFPNPVSKATSRTRDKIVQSELFPTERYIDKDAARKNKDFQKRIERRLIRAIHLDDEESYNRNRQRIIDHNARVGAGATSAIRVPATWERVQEVRASYEKAKEKLMKRIEKAARDGDRERYLKEEARFLRIRRNLGVKVGDTARYIKGDAWYRLEGGLNAMKKQKQLRESKLPDSNWRQINSLYVSQAYDAARRGDAKGFMRAIDGLDRLRKKAESDGINIRVTKMPKWEKAREKVDQYDKKFASLLKEVERSAAKGDFNAANRGVDALYKLHLAQGERLGASFPSDRVEFARRGREFRPTPTTARTYPLRNPDDFRNVERWTGTISRGFHDKFAKLFNLGEYYGSAEREKILDRLGISEATFAKARSSVIRYTGTYYQLIKDARTAVAEGRTLSPNLRNALSIGRLIERFISAFPKEEIPKFRGGRVTDDTLKALIETSRMKGEFGRWAGMITSWTSDLGSARGFAENPPESVKNKPNRVILQTINKRGIPIESITTAPNEMELLTSGRARYTHTGRYNVVYYEGQTYHIFEVIER